MKSVCVFCGSSAGGHPGYEEAARELGVLLAGEKIHLVYGGAGVGLMGVLADTVLGQGGMVTGVIPSFFSRKEIAHHGLSELIFVDSMHERKQVMAGLSEAFLAMPGGFGTLDELFEVLTWSQLDLHQKPIGLLNVNGYFDALVSMFDHMVAEKFVKSAHRQLIVEDDKAAPLLQKMKEFKPIRLEKWLNRIKT